MLGHTQRLSVPFEYPVYFTEGVFSPQNPDLAEAIGAREPGRRHRLLAVIDSGVADAWPSLPADIGRYVEAHAERLRLAAAPIVVPGGEASKNDPAHTERLQGHLDALGMDRHAFVVIVGGGAVLDMAGYAAATVHRGVRVVRVPTTVLAQADSGVGVKNGINAFGKKNFLGTFVPPYAVIVDSRFLETLPARERIAGMAEAVKVALVRDADLFAWLQREAPALAAGALGPLAELVRRSAMLHLRHIATGGDPFELGSARPLDFGHWAAHKLETLTEHRLRHGEAVAIGIALDAIYSELAGLCDPAVTGATLALLEALGLPGWDDALDLRGPGGAAGLSGEAPGCGQEPGGAAGLSGEAPGCGQEPGGAAGLSGEAPGGGPPAGGRRLVLAGLAEFQEHLGGELTVTMLQALGRGVEVHEVHERLVEMALGRLRERRDRAAR